MLKLISCVAMLLIMSGCSDQGNDVVSEVTSTKPSKSAGSKLNSYLSEEKICDVLSPQALQLFADGTAEIEKLAGKFRNNATCVYLWPRPDAEERKANMIKATIASVTGDGPKLSMREMMTEYKITIAMEASTRMPDTFMPPKLSEEQLTAQIESMKKRTAERLTDEQKALAGDAANSMLERSLRKNNQNLEVDEIGGAAYWSDLGTGSLEVLDGDVKITISPILADTKEADIENAKKIALQLLN